ncbi:hypothetical protein [Lentzea sp. E54]|uniref:hypothetical protein n=1 Tax=Lentzea xerophila TaxID=3435883 RepID=UPI003DA23832
MKQDTRVLLPVFCGSQLDVALAVVDFVHDSVRKTVWPADRIRESYLRRSVSEILADGDTMVFGPCPDRTFVASCLLGAHGIDHVLIYHERRVPGYGPSTAHLALETTLDGTGFMMDFGTRESRLIPGGYHFTEELEETIALKRIPLRSFDPDGVAPYQLLQHVVSDKIDPELKLDWYAKQSRNFRPDALRDRLALDQRYSVYHEL